MNLRKVHAGEKRGVESGGKHLRNHRKGERRRTRGDAKRMMKAKFKVDTTARKKVRDKSRV